tara:strand:+ start:377 stop:619 length:243 start_codon:yes stop_codon:yes gene_type:complete
MRSKITKRKTSTYSATAIKLSAHEKLCAERMNTIIKSVEQLRKDVSELKANVNKGKGAVAVLIFLGSLITAIFGYFKWNA